MVDEREGDQEQSVTCVVCQMRIPRRAAWRTQAPDYTLYFCAQCCHEEWSPPCAASREHAFSAS